MVVLLCPLCCLSVFWVDGVGGATHRLSFFPPVCNRGVHGLALLVGAYQERTRWDPKDGELCLARLKSGETLMEDRSDSVGQVMSQS